MIWRRASLGPSSKIPCRIASSGSNTSRRWSRSARVGKTCIAPATRCSNMTTHLFGIRHHGPGCARSLRLALEALNPDIVLIEGPPDAQEVLPLMRHKTMTPPVALLIYAPDTPSKAVYYPFARFSPEWQALDYALRHKLPVRFIDLPQEIQLAR